MKDYGVNPDTFITDAARCLIYFMSERAVNEKKSDKLLQAWQDDQLSKRQDNPDAHNLYCTAHVHLGFHHYIRKDLETYQKTATDDGSGRLGRHSESFIRPFKLLQAASRVCSVASNVFTPVWDHLGLRDIWEAFCSERSVSPLITNL